MGQRSGRSFERHRQCEFHLMLQLHI
jgi:hypothetical protein